MVSHAHGESSVLLYRLTRAACSSSTCLMTAPSPRLTLRGAGVLDDVVRAADVAVTLVPFCVVSSTALSSTAEV